MSFENEPKTNTLNLPEDELTAFAERMKRIFESISNKGEKLRDLYTTNPESFRDTLDDLTEEIAQEYPPFKEDFLELKKVRQVRGNEAPIIGRLNDTRSKIKQIIVSEAGLPDEARFSQIENAKKNIANKINEALDGRSLTDPTEALDILGIKTTEDDKTTYHFPYDLMPESVVDKWETYIATVCKHLQLAEDVIRTGDRKSVEDADRARTFAHNSVTNDVHVILGLEGIDGWDRLKTRELLAKIRDNELPSRDVATGEYGHHLVETKSNQIKVVTALAQH